MDFYVGTSGYSYPEWEGRFYPEKLPARQMLRFYGENFRTVEVNYTFRRMPTVPLLEGRAASVPYDFRFVLKAPERITHRQRLKDVGDSLSRLLDVAAALKGRLGPLLFQLPPDFRKDAGRLRDFLALLPPGTRAAFEFRHASWLDDEVFGLLRERQAALCLAEADDGLDTPIAATAGWGYLRLRRANYDDGDLRMWLRRLRDQDWREAFVFFRHEDQAHGPRLAKRFLALAAEP